MKFCIGNFGDIAFDFGFDTGATLLGVIKKAHFSEKISLVEVGNNNFFAFIIFNHHRN